MHGTLDEFTDFALRMAQMNPKGFRDPRSGKRANASDRGPTLMERLARAAGHDIDWRGRETSPRGEEKRRQRWLARERMKDAAELRDAYRKSHPSRRWAKAAPEKWRPE